MEIRVKLLDIVSASAALQDLAQQRLVARAGLQIGRAVKVVSAELETYNQTRFDLVKKHGGVANSQTNQFEFKDINPFNNEFRNLLETEITLNVDKIKLADLADCKPTVATMMQLAWLIDDSDAPK